MSPRKATVAARGHMLSHAPPVRGRGPPPGRGHARFDLEPFKRCAIAGVTLQGAAPRLPGPNRLTVTFGQRLTPALLRAQAAGAATRSARLGEHPSWLELLIPF